MAKAEKVTVTTGSAFHALGLPDADDLVLRSALLKKAGAAIRKMGVSQTRIGKLIGMDQPRVSALLNGKISLFSTDKLVSILTALGQDVEVRVRPSKEGRGQLFVPS